MNVTTKRFFSVVICFMFQIFIMSSGFSKVYATNPQEIPECTVEYQSTMIPLMKINSLFNSSIIWDQGDDESSLDTENEGNNLEEKWDNCDGMTAFYVNDPERNNGVGGFPQNGEVSIGEEPNEVPFVVKKNESGNDCIQLTPTESFTAMCSDPLGPGTKYKNLFIFGTLSSSSLEKTSAQFNVITVANTDANTEEEKSYSCELYYYTNLGYNPRRNYETENLDSLKEAGRIYDYTTRFNSVINIGDPVTSRFYSYNGAALQCIKIPIQEGYENIKSIQIVADNLSEDDDDILWIFGVTAEIKTDLAVGFWPDSSPGTKMIFAWEAPATMEDWGNLTSRAGDNVVVSLFQNLPEFYLDASGRGGRSDIRTMYSAQDGLLMYDPSLAGFLQDPIIYIEVYNSTAQTYQYLRLRTDAAFENPNTSSGGGSGSSDGPEGSDEPGYSDQDQFSLTLSLKGFYKRFNGQNQTLVHSPVLLSIQNLETGETSDVSDSDLYKSNIFLRLSNAKYPTDTETFNTGWYDLYHIDKLCALNAGTYYVHYYINTDALPDITYPAHATITII